jgi:5-formyltetrahydrofolate cyclo-ligase
MSLSDEKQARRRAVAARIDALAPAVRTRHDAALRNAFLALPAVAGAGLVFGYAPLADEVDVLPLLQALRDRGVRVGLPRVDGDALVLHEIGDLDRDLARGVYGIREPRADLPHVDPAAIDVVLTPGRAFDTAGNRLGRGGGYYDRFLATTPARRIALAYEEQILPDVPAGPDDLPVHLVVTPQRLIEPPRHTT